MMQTATEEKEERCPLCGGRLLRDALRGVAYCDDCWTEVALCGRTR